MRTIHEKVCTSMAYAKNAVDGRLDALMLFWCDEVSVPFCVLLSSLISSSFCIPPSIFFLAFPQLALFPFLKIFFPISYDEIMMAQDGATFMTRGQNPT